MDAQIIKQNIKAEAIRLGFDVCGVTLPVSSQDFEIYQDWIDQGRQAGMAYLARPDAVQRRARPQLILPGCRTILCLGIRYAEGNRIESARAAPITGRVAAYAQGKDYHPVILERLQQLTFFIRQNWGENILARPYTDTGPVLERSLAQQAGLGWIGKNSCLIVPHQGSYYFLAELFLDLDLPPDTPYTSDGCACCQRCIQACPTACILPNRTLDAGRCISYLTIENKAEIPEELRPLVGDWVFGCDICQSVCPYNRRFACNAQVDPAFKPLQGLSSLDIEQVLNLSPEEFKLRFKDSPILRTKLTGLQRNARVVLHNLKK